MSSPTLFSRPALGRSGRATALFLIAFTAAWLSGCAGLPPRPEQPVTQALENPGSTPLGRFVARSAPGPRVSGLRTLIAGDDALDARLALADNASRTLDLQYYAISKDVSAHVILERVHAAADRGVRVRLLLDDLNTAGADEALLALMQRPNVEVRLYNPFPNGRASVITRVLGSLGDLARINRRMHNKLFVADNALAITGGRNLGDPYFVRSDTSNFVDLDLLVAGPAARALSRSFDRFWNGPLAYPAAMFIERPAPPRPDLQSDPLPIDPPPKAAAAAPAEEAVHAKLQPRALSRQLAAGELPLVWAPARVIADRPSKLGHDDEPAPQETMFDNIDALLRSAKREVILVSPYFVPGAHGMALLRELRARGVAVRVLTSSLAATDAPAVHIGYARYREDLLRMGVMLHELRPEVGRTEVRLGSFGSSSSKLHAKAFVVDKQVVLIGSMNFDPRSDRLNTEVGVLVHSGAISREIAAMYESICNDAAWRLALDADGGLRWTAKPDADSQLPVVATSEPGASLWLRAALRLLAPLAPDELL